MTRRLTLRTETIAALTTEDLSSVVGGGGESFHCTSPVVPIYINQPEVLCAWSLMCRT